MAAASAKAGRKILSNLMGLSQSDLRAVLLTGTDVFVLELDVVVVEVLADVVVVVTFPAALVSSPLSSGGTAPLFVNKTGVCGSAALLPTAFRFSRAPNSCPSLFLSTASLICCSSSSSSSSTDHLLLLLTFDLSMLLFFSSKLPFVAICVLSEGD